MTSPIDLSALVRYEWECNCKAIFQVQPEALRLGSILRCPACKQTYGCVRHPHDRKIWVRIDDLDVEFHALMDAEAR